MRLIIIVMALLISGSAFGNNNKGWYSKQKTLKTESSLYDYHSIKLITKSKNQIC